MLFKSERKIKQEIQLDSGSTCSGVDATSVCYDEEKAALEDEALYI